MGLREVAFWDALRTVSAGKCRECLDGPHYRHGTNREAGMWPDERSVDRVIGLLPVHLPRPAVSSLRQRLRAHGARIPEIHSGLTTYNFVITSKLYDLCASISSFS